MRADEVAVPQCVAGAVDAMITDAPDAGADARRFCDTYSKPRIGALHSVCLRALNRAYREAPLTDAARVDPPTFNCPLWRAPHRARGSITDKRARD